MAETRILEHLKHLRRRGLSLATAAGAAWGWVLVCGLGLAAAWLDLLFELSPGLRTLLVAVLFAAAIVTMLRRLLGAARGATRGGLARRLDEAGGTRGQILSGIELMGAGYTGSALTAGLAELAIERAAGLALQVTPPRAFPMRPVTRAVVAGLGSSLAVALLVVLFPAVARTQWLRFTDPWGDHPPYSPLTFTVEPGDASVVYGQGLDVRVTTQGAPVERLELVLESGGPPQSLPMFLEPSGQWRGTIASVTETGHYYVQAMRARSARFRLNVITVPRITQVRFRITPPAYTNIAPYEGPLPSSGIVGLAGTRVDVTATSNRQLSGGKLALTTDLGPSEVTLAPAAAGGMEVMGSFELMSAGQLRLRVTDTDGQTSTDEFAASLTLLADQRPFVRILEPRPVSFATPDVVLPVALSAEDDYGVARLQVYRSLNDSRPLPTDRPVPQPFAKIADDVYALPLSTYGLEPGDTIKIFARVEDNDPLGAKGAESQIVQIQIISRADFDELIRTQAGLEALQSKYQEAERRMEALAEQLEKLAKEMENQSSDGELTEAQREALQKLADQMANDAAELQKTAGVRLPYDVDRPLTERLQELADKLSQAGKETAGLGMPGGAKPGDAQKKLAEMRDGLKKQRDAYKKDLGEPLDQLAAAIPLKEDEGRFLMLVEQQKQLAERLAALKGQDGTDDPSQRARLRDLEAEQSQVRAALRDLLADMRTHLTELPDEKQFANLRKTATKFAKELSESGAAEAMAAAETGLAELSGTRGYAGAKEAAEILEKFVGHCNSMGQCASNCLKFSPSVSECLGNSLSQLLASSGFDEGSGSGYSARANSMQNVGLYGALPTQQPGLRGERSDRNAGASATQRPGDGSPFDAAAVRAGSSLRAAGNQSASVPLRYRKRVADYFQRITDELGDREQPR